MQDETMKSTDDARINVSGIRHKYRTLSDSEKREVDDIKDQAQELWDAIDSVDEDRSGQGRSKALAKTKLEEAVFWAVHAVTSPEEKD